MRLAHLTASFLLIAEVSFAVSSPAYLCKDNDKSQYRVWLGKDRNVLEIVKGGQTQEISLAAANLEREPENAENRLVYNQWNPKTTDKYGALDLTNEFSVQHKNEAGATVVYVGLIINSIEHTGVQCQSVGVLSQVKTLPANGAMERHAKLLADGGDERDANGKLIGIGIKSFEAALRRITHTPQFETRFNQLFEEVGPAIKKLSPASVSEIEKRLDPVANALFNKLLVATNYRYYPETQRFISWVVDGARPSPQRNLFSVHAGMASFVAGGTYKEKDLKDIFANEVIPSLKNLNETELTDVRKGMSTECSQFTFDLWSKAVGKKSLVDYPEVDRMVRGIASVIEQNKTQNADSFDAQKVETYLSQFYKSPYANNPEAESLFVQAASVLVHHLSPRQKEDVLAWVSDENAKKKLQELWK